MNLSDLEKIVSAATHVAVDPDDNQGFTDHCFKAFCAHYGYDYPLDEKYKYHAQTLWNETPGDAFRAAWNAGVQYPVDPKLVGLLLAAYRAAVEMRMALSLSFQHGGLPPHCYTDHNYTLSGYNGDPEEIVSFDKAREALDSELSRE